MKVLFCTDGSEISMNAFYNFAELAKEATIDTICVIDWSFLPASMNIEHEEYTKAYENIAESVLNYAQKAIEEKNLTVGEKIQSVGSAAEGILEQLEKEDYDLVLMGSHGKKGIQKWLGSVSRQVISNTLVPIFVSKKIGTSVFEIKLSYKQLNANLLGLLQLFYSYANTICNDDVPRFLSPT